jgi:hypothetical protein
LVRFHRRIEGESTVACPRLPFPRPVYTARRRFVKVIATECACRKSNTIVIFRGAQKPASSMPATASGTGFFCRFFLRGLRLSRRRTFRGFFRSGRFFSSTRGGGRFLFGRLFIGIASIVCDVKSRPLEDQTRAGAKQTLHFPMAPLRQSTKLFRAFAKWFITHRLECVEVLAALFARILVGWHDLRCLRFAGNAGKSALNRLQFNPCAADVN